MSELLATHEAEVAEILRTSSSVRLFGVDSGQSFRRPVTAEVSLRIGSRGVIEHDVADQVVVVSGGATLAEVQSELVSKGQCLPLGILAPDATERLQDAKGTIAGQLSLDLPHTFQAACGSWRDWVLGLTVVRPDGFIAKCGSKAVKSVAGYDVAKLFVGARGTLGVITQVILRTYPVRALPRPDLSLRSATWTSIGRVQRTLASDFEAATEAYGDRVLAASAQTSTLYISCENDRSTHRFAEDWQLGWGHGADNLVLEDPTLKRWMVRTKQIMDPENKLNPGEMLS